MLLNDSAPPDSADGTVRDHQPHHPLADHWDLGLDTWHVRIGAAFDVDQLTSALSTHLGADLDEPGVLQAAADHGMHVLHGTSRMRRA